MTRSDSPLEIEIKLMITGTEAARNQLHGLGFSVRTERRFEANTVFDTTGLELRNQRSLLRLREVGEESIVTYKGAPTPGKHKSREEIEIHVSDGRAVQEILERLGFRPVFRYEKYRTEFTPPAEGGLVTLDETPIGNYLELEGSPDWIDRTARQLGFSEGEYITASYGTLFQKYRELHHLSSEHMVFPTAD